MYKTALFIALTYSSLFAVQAVDIADEIQPANLNKRVHTKPHTTTHLRHTKTAHKPKKKITHKRISTQQVEGRRVKKPHPKGYRHTQNSWYLTYKYEGAHFYDRHGYYYGDFNHEGYFFEGEFYRYDRDYTYRDRVRGKELFSRRFYRPLSQTSLHRGRDYDRPHPRPYERERNYPFNLFIR